jgi:hypothetical protein
MNVTIKIDDSLCRDARHRAVDRGLSLSKWIAEVLRRELQRNERQADVGSLLELLAMDSFDDRDFEVTRDPEPPRAVSFS